MDKINWPVAAGLMRYWFKGKPWATADGGMDELTKDHKKEPLDPYVESSIVKMAWVLKFERANKVFKELKLKWNSPNALIRMRNDFPTKFAGKVDGAYQQNLQVQETLRSLGIPIQSRFRPQMLIFSCWMS